MTEPHTRQCDDPQLRTWQGSQGDLMQTCESCGRISPAEQPDPDPEDELTRPKHRHRRWLGCCRCGASIWTDNPRPRLPICDSCRHEEDLTR